MVTGVRNRGLPTLCNRARSWEKYHGSTYVAGILVPFYMSLVRPFIRFSIDTFELNHHTLSLEPGQPGADGSTEVTLPCRYGLSP